MGHRGRKVARSRNELGSPGEHLHQRRHREQNDVGPDLGRVHGGLVLDDHRPQVPGRGSGSGTRSPRRPNATPTASYGVSSSTASRVRCSPRRIRYSIDRLGVSNGRDDGAIVRIGDAWLSENHLDGSLTREGKTLSWSIDFAPAPECFQHLPASVARPDLEACVDGVLPEPLGPYDGSGQARRSRHRTGERPRVPVSPVGSQALADLDVGPLLRVG